MLCALLGSGDAYCAVGCQSCAAACQQQLGWDNYCCYQSSCCCYRYATQCSINPSCPSNNCGGVQAGSLFEGATSTMTTCGLRSDQCVSGSNISALASFAGNGDETIQV